MIYIRSIILYLVLVAVIRLMGKRQIAQMGAAEFVVTMMAANLTTIPIQDEDIPLSAGIIPILMVLAVQIFLSKLSLRSVPMRRLLCGKPVILIDNGKILSENLRRTRLTLDELTGHLRQKNVMDIKTVQYAILETDGNLSVFPYPKEVPAPAKAVKVAVEPRYLPVTIISDGVLLEKNLPAAGKDRAWVDKVLGQHGADIKSTWLLTVDKGDTIRFYKKE